MHKPKIAIFIPSFPVLSETFIERELYELSKANRIDFSIFSLKKENEFNYPTLANKVIYFNLKEQDILAGFIQVLFSHPLSLLSAFFLILKNPKRSILSNIYIYFKALGYAHLFKNQNIDHLHAHFFSEASTICLLVSIFLNTKLSISGHAKDILDMDVKSNSKPELISEKIHRSSFVVLCNKKAFEACTKYASQDDISKIQLVYHGVDFSKYAISNDKYEKPTIYFVGRFVAKKGLIYLLEAVSILKSEGLVFQVLIAGFGPEYESLKSYVATNQLEEFITFINDGVGLKNDESLNYLSKSDIFVAPSINLDLGDSDGIPNNILEAGLFSIPVVSTNAGSISEIITHMHSGILVSQKDSKALAEGIKTLINNASLRSSLGNTLNSIVKEKFDSAKNVLEFERLFLQ